MNSVEQEGHEAIRKAVRSCSAPVILVEMTRQFGDLLHSTLVVRHLRKTHPDASIVWAIGGRYADTFDAFSLKELGPHVIASLPDLPPWPKDGTYRIAWVRAAAELDNVERSFGCGVHPWGWKFGSIVDAVLNNSGIETLSVPRTPWLPITSDDANWAQAFIEKNGLSHGFVSLEYVSRSLDTNSPAWFANMAARLPLPCVSLAEPSDPLVPGTVDGRGTTLRQAKALICKSSSFVGSGSGLSVMATSNGCDTPMVELVAHPLSSVGIGYRRHTDRNICLSNASPEVVADAVLPFLPQPRPDRRTMRDRARRRKKS